MTPSQLIAAEVLAEPVHEHQFNGAGLCRCEPGYVDLTAHTHDLTVVFMDDRTEVLPGIESHRIDNNVLRLRCRDAGKHSVYSLPLVNIRMWHRELT